MLLFFKANKMVRKARILRRRPVTRFFGIPIIPESARKQNGPSMVWNPGYIARVPGEEKVKVSRKDAYKKLYDLQNGYIDQEGNWHEAVWEGSYDRLMDGIFSGTIKDPDELHTSYGVVRPAPPTGGEDIRNVLKRDNQPPEWDGMIRKENRGPVEWRRPEDIQEEYSAIHTREVPMNFVMKGETTDKMARETKKLIAFPRFWNTNYHHDDWTIKYAKTWRMNGNKWDPLPAATKQFLLRYLQFVEKGGDPNDRMYEMQVGGLQGPVKPGQSQQQQHEPEAPSAVTAEQKNAEHDSEFSDLPPSKINQLFPQRKTFAEQMQDKWVNNPLPAPGPAPWRLGNEKMYPTIVEPPPKREQTVDEFLDEQWHGQPADAAAATPFYPILEANEPVAEEKPLLPYPTLRNDNLPPIAPELNPDWVKNELYPQLRKLVVVKGGGVAGVGKVNKMELLKVVEALDNVGVKIEPRNITPMLRELKAKMAGKKTAGKITDVSNIIRQAAAPAPAPTPAVPDHAPMDIDRDGTELEPEDENYVTPANQSDEHHVRELAANRARWRAIIQREHDLHAERLKVRDRVRDDRAYINDFRTNRDAEKYDRLSDRNKDIRSNFENGATNEDVVRANNLRHVPFHQIRDASAPVRSAVGDGKYMSRGQYLPLVDTPGTALTSTSNFVAGDSVDADAGIIDQMAKYEDYTSGELQMMLERGFIPQHEQAPVRNLIARKRERENSDPRRENEDLNVLDDEPNPILRAGRSFEEAQMGLIPTRNNLHHRIRDVFQTGYRGRNDANDDYMNSSENPLLRNIRKGEEYHAHGTADLDTLIYKNQEQELRSARAYSALSKQTTRNYIKQNMIDRSVYAEAARNTPHRYDDLFQKNNLKRSDIRSDVHAEVSDDAWMLMLFKR